MRVLTIFSLFLLGLTLNVTISSSSIAQTRSDYLGAYRDWMVPTGNVGLNQAPAKTNSLTVKVEPRRDFRSLGDSEAYYGAYLEWVLPTRNLGLSTATAQPKYAAVQAKPRTNYDHGNSGSFYDFYLDWMLPRVKPETPRTIPFLTRLITRQRSDVHSQVYSLDNHK